MTDRSILTVGVAVFFLALLRPAAAFATVKCQCNNGELSEAMGADYDDDDVEESCNDACSEMGGGRVWNVDTDGEGENVTIHSGERSHEEPVERR